MFKEEFKVYRIWDNLLRKYAKSKHSSIWYNKGHVKVVLKNLNKYELDRHRFQVLEHDCTFLVSWNEKEFYDWC